MILCLASSNWLTAEKFRQGLWEQCVDEGAKQPLPFELKVKPGCYPARRVGKKVDFIFLNQIPRKEVIQFISICIFNVCLFLTIYTITNL